MKIMEEIQLRNEVKSLQDKVALQQKTLDNLFILQEKTTIALFALNENFLNYLSGMAKSR